VSDAARAVSVHKLVPNTQVHRRQVHVQVVVSVAEHHANIVPWQIVCKARGATLKHVGLTASQELDIDDLRSKVSTTFSDQLMNGSIALKYA
jgi:selenocysteine lyase/cysteine desulfurase